MMNIVVVLFYVGIVAVPVVMGIFSSMTGYEAPKSLTESLKGQLRGVPIMLTLFAVINWSRIGFAFDKWHWGMLLILPIMLLLAFLVDWFLIRRREKRNAI